MKKVGILDDHYLTNREKKQRCSKNAFWCMTCDANMVGEFGKCSVCGRHNSKGKRLKLK